MRNGAVSSFAGGSADVIVAVAGVSVINNVLMWADWQYTCYNGFLCPVVNGIPTDYCNGACFNIFQYQ